MTPNEIIHTIVCLTWIAPVLVLGLLCILAIVLPMRREQVPHMTRQDVERTWWLAEQRKHVA